jgi:uroporphyrinogen-III decarboxylase
MVKTSIAFGYDVYAWYAGRSLRDYYLDRKAAWEINETARRRIADMFGWHLGVKMPYLAYASLTALGVEISYPQDGQPMITRPIVSSPEDLESLPRVKDVMSAGAIPHVIDLWKHLCDCEGKEVPLTFGNEGPITAAVLIRGVDFLIDVLESPQFAHRLLSVVADLFIETNRGCQTVLAQPPSGGTKGMADDFAGLLAPAQYREFVVPYYNRIYGSLGAERRELHSELLRPDHLPILAEFQLNHFDPHTDQYLTVRDMVERMPQGISWNWRILSSSVVTGTPEGLTREFEGALADGADDFLVFISAPVKPENVRAVAALARKHGTLTVT